MSQCVCDLAHAVRTASGGRKLVVFFYGYLFEFAAAPNGPLGLGPLRAPPRAGLSRYRHPLLADLVL